MRPIPSIGESLKPGGMLREVAAATGRRIVFFCAFGERSAMAVAAAKEAGLANTAHIAGGIDAWKKAGGPVLTGDPRTTWCVRCRSGPKMTALHHDCGFSLKTSAFPRKLG